MSIVNDSSFIHKVDKRLEKINGKRKDDGCILLGHGALHLLGQINMLKFHGGNFDPPGAG